MNNVFIIIAISILLLGCTQECKITDYSSDDNNYLMEGEYYCLARDSVCTYALGEYQMIDGNITFRDSVSGFFYTIKKINE